MIVSAVVASTVTKLKLVKCDRNNTSSIFLTFQVSFLVTAIEKPPTTSLVTWNEQQAVVLQPLLQRRRSSLLTR